MSEAILKTGQQTADHLDVLRLADVEVASVSGLLSTYGLTLTVVPAGGEIPGSFWGDEEAGLIGNELLVRADTPLHSILHETCHYVCMDKARREDLDTDAGGDYDEENGVCYLQILLADHIAQFGRLRMIKDMDRWGYTFRLGSALAWFERDAEDAMAWLLERNLITQFLQPSWSLRKD
ncbi:MAG: hypothetical protein QNK19_17630 [Xanthomonadales bacterium]|nr:hypothetical protein [Xanthomonadales bacterium]